MNSRENLKKCEQLLEDASCATDTSIVYCIEDDDDCCIGFIGEDQTVMELRIVLAGFTRLIKRMLIDAGAKDVSKLIKETVTKGLTLPDAVFEDEESVG